MKFNSFNLSKITALYRLLKIIIASSYEKIIVLEDT
jgi:hypothetical protein